MMDYRDTNQNTGYLSAHTVLEVTDIFGKAVIRRVNIGRCHDISLLDAQHMIAQARERNPERYIQAEFKISL